MRAKAMLLAVLAALLGGCGPAPAHWRGEQTKRDIYLNLMTTEQAARFRYLESEHKDDELLLLYCQEVGAYQKWHAASPERQKLIRRRRVEVGMAPDEVQMAWGRPARTEEVTTLAERAEGHKRDLWSFGETSEAEGGEAFERQVCFLDARVLWYKDFREGKSLWRRMQWWK